VFCHEQAHIQRDEMGAPEFFTGGAKLLPIAGAHGKLDPAALTTTITTLGAGWSPKPACVSLTQATEAGTIYSVDEVRALTAVARTFGCRTHMDGARFANAVVSSGAAPAELTWQAGVDVLVFGGTKNGAMAAELIVVFDQSLASEFATRWHRAGHRLSKMRFLSAQFEAYLENDLWLRNARHANAMAARLASGLGDRVIHPVEANVLFARFPKELSASLAEQGFLFFDWTVFGEDAVRLVCGFDTTEAEVDALVQAVRAGGA
jgi:threonine aldolase